MPQRNLNEPIQTTDQLYKDLEGARATENGVQISGQDIYDRFIRPGEQARVNSILSGLQRQGTQAGALQRGQNTDLARRMGFAGTGLETALGDSLSAAMAKRRADALSEARGQLQEMSSDPARFDVLRRAAEAFQRRVTRDTVANTTWGGIDAAVGGGLAASGNPIASGIGAGVLIGGAIRGGAMSAGIAGGAAQGAKRFSPNNIKSLDLTKLAQGVGSGGQGQRAVGFQGSGREGSLYRRALDDEYGNGGY